MNLKEFYEASGRRGSYKLRSEYELFEFSVSPGELGADGCDCDCGCSGMIDVWVHSPFFDDPIMVIWHKEIEMCMGGAEANMRAAVEDGNFDLFLSILASQLGCLTPCKFLRAGCSYPAWHPLDRKMGVCFLCP